MNKNIDKSKNELFAFLHNNMKEIDKIIEESE
jgi:hypothetical protein